ncbi:unnamed protein product [Triticum turgidum subsp. durum]|uniref:Peptidase S59 domain-containing protein n=1 Tax=Triticum turgidum subsp. durum TaxID=4567 RepID=A0A9R1RZR4_TRITD|nr:unnamed protein product [Triticum turgidum subsp. durum]
MFGSTNPFGQSSASAFGQTSSNPFGAQSGFGQTSTTTNNPFGSPTTAFGAQTGTTSPFGATSSTAGAFGQPSAPAFGATSTPAFGAAPIGGFGQPSTPAFGTPSSSPFGSSTPAFGASPAPAFGAGATSSGFGSGSLFGQKPSFGGFGSSPFAKPSTGGFGATPNPFSSPTVTPFGQTSSSAFSANTSPSLFANTTPSLFSTPSTTPNLFNNSLSISNNTQSAGLFQSSPAIAPFSQSFSQQSSTPAFSTGIFNTPNPGMTGGLFGNTSSPFLTSTFQQSAPVQQTPSLFSFQPQTQPASTGGFTGFSNTMNLAPFGQQTTSQSNMVMQPTLVSNPFGTLPAMPQMSIGNGGSAPSIQYGISSLPVPEKPLPSRTVSMVVPRHLSQRRIKLLPRKYNQTSDGKVPFFADDEESPATPKADAFFIPRENPRSLIIRPTDQWRSRSAADRQSVLRDSTDLDKHNDALVGKERGKAVVSPARSGSVENGTYRDEHHQALPEAHANGSSVEKLIPKLSQADYFTEPSLEELAAKERAEPGYCSRVRDFVVGRQGYGSIKFMGETDVRGLDLESIVEFNNREVIVYKDDNEKPQVGEGLNKAAVVTLLNIKCVNRKTGDQYTEGPRVDKYKEMLVKKAEEQGVEFISFDAAKGEWKFKVKHFSSYGFAEAEVGLVDSL